MIVIDAWSVLRDSCEQLDNDSLVVPESIVKALSTVRGAIGSQTSLQHVCPTAGDRYQSSFPSSTTPDRDEW